MPYKYIHIFDAIIFIICLKFIQIDATYSEIKHLQQNMGFSQLIYSWGEIYSSGAIACSV